MELKQEIIKLWEECFNDSSDFLNFYFHDRYREKHNHYLAESNRIVAAMQIYPYLLKFKDNLYKAGYIYGACTSPNFRNKGYMNRLMHQVMQQLYKENYDLLFLIPASQSLYDFYSKFDFVTGFYHMYRTYKKEWYTDSPIWKTIEEYNKEDFLFIEKHEKKHNNLILHSSHDYQTIIKEISISKGKICKATNSFGDIEAIALIYPNINRQLIVKGYYGKEQNCQYLISSLCDFLSEEKLTFFSPPERDPSMLQATGMLRILHPEKFLEHINVSNEENIPINNLYITDNAIIQNNNLWKKKRSAKTIQKLTISEFTESLFKTTPLYMNWMMD